MCVPSVNLSLKPVAVLAVQSCIVEASRRLFHQLVDLRRQVLGISSSASVNVGSARVVSACAGGGVCAKSSVSLSLSLRVCERLSGIGRATNALALRGTCPFSCYVS
jgi:hypothetical protein